MREIKLIYFDIGGTLSASKLDLFGYIAEQYSDKSKDRIKEILENSFSGNFNGRDQKRFMDVALMIKTAMIEAEKKLGLGSLNERAHDLYEDVYLKNAILYPEVKEVLSEIKRKGIRMIVLSDADSDVLLEGLKWLGIYEYFDDFIVSSDVKAYKPSDKIVKAALNLLSVSPDKAMVVGDSRVDIESAKKMGVTSVLINRWDNEGKGVEPDYTIKSLKELLDKIK